MSRTVTFPAGGMLPARHSVAGIALQQPAYMLNSVDRALTLVQVLRDTGTIRLVDASSLLNVSPSTAHRLLSMLVYRGFAIQNDAREYLAGPSIIEAAVVPPNVSAARAAVHPRLTELARSTGQTANFMIRVGPSVRVVSTAVGDGESAVGDRRGVVVPALRTAAGRAILAGLDEQEARTLVARNTQPDQISAVLNELKEITEKGFALTWRTVEDNLGAVGVAITEGGQEIGAISLSFQTHQFSEALLRRLTRDLLAIRRDFSTAIPQAV